MKTSAGAAASICFARVELAAIGGGGILALFALVSGVHLVERVFETGRGKNDQLLALRRRRGGAPREARQCEQDGHQQIA